MKLITRTASAIAFSATLLVSASAFAFTPFDAATSAYRGQLEGISGYQSLQANLKNRSITGEDILKAAGLDVNRSDARFVESILRDRDSN